jgi:hypothetical protein
MTQNSQPGGTTLARHAVASVQGTITFDGYLLGETTSHQPEHFNHVGEFARKGERCYACRWSEYSVYRVHPDDQQKVGGIYLVASYGQTIVPGETIFRRVSSTTSPAEVVEMLTTRKFGQPPVLTSSAARLLAQASDRDVDIQEAYDNRTVL